LKKKRKTKCKKKRKNRKVEKKKNVILKKKKRKKEKRKKLERKIEECTVDYCCNPQYIVCGGTVIPPHHLEYC
jgi:hypothetical protein